MQTVGRKGHGPRSKDPPWGPQQQGAVLQGPLQGGGFPGEPGFKIYWGDKVEGGWFLPLSCQGHKGSHLLSSSFRKRTCLHPEDRKTRHQKKNHPANS